MCRVYGVTRAGFYAWRKREASVRAGEDIGLLERIRVIFAGSRGTYGSPRVWAALKAQGVRIAPKRVARLMREAGLQARLCGLYRAVPGLHRFFTEIPNTLRECAHEKPNDAWVADVTYLKVGGVWRYLAVVMDRVSRRILGWSLKARRDVSLTLAALNQAARYRRPPAGAVFHTDRGIEYAAHVFRNRLVRLGMKQSMNRPGKMTDNAFMESFFHSMKADVIHGQAFSDDRSLRKTIRGYIQFYNHERLHSSLGYVPPAAFEKRLA